MIDINLPHPDLAVATHRMRPSAALRGGWQLWPDDLKLASMLRQIAILNFNNPF